MSMHNDVMNGVFASAAFGYAIAKRRQHEWRSQHGNAMTPEGQFYMWTLGLPILLVVLFAAGIFWLFAYAIIWAIRHYVTSGILLAMAAAAYAPAMKHIDSLSPPDVDLANVSTPAFFKKHLEGNWAASDTSYYHPVFSFTQSSYVPPDGEAFHNTGLQFFGNGRYVLFRNLSKPCHFYGVRIVDNDTLAHEFEEIYADKRCHDRADKYSKWIFDKPVVYKRTAPRAQSVEEESAANETVDIFLSSVVDPIIIDIQKTWSGVKAAMTPNLGLLFR